MTAETIIVLLAAVVVQLQRIIPLLRGVGPAVARTERKVDAQLAHDGIANAEPAPVAVASSREAA